MNLRATAAAEERRVAFRALLSAPFLDAGDPAYGLVRRHQAELGRVATDVFGYRLLVGATAARLVGTPTERSARRALRVPSTASARQRPRDEWPALSDRAAVLMLCTLAALERGGAQTALAELARDTAAAAADCEPPILVDFSERAERLAFADGLELLVSWGIVEHTSGSRASYRTLESGDDEALLTVDRKRLAAVLRDPAQALAAPTVTAVGDDDAGYAPTPEGARRALAHRLAQRLLEDPVLLLAELDDTERAYFLGQRARLEDAVAEATGLAIERRAEGTALIADDRALTDVPFPTRATGKQVALLLCDALRRENDATAVPRLRALVRALATEYHAHWQRDPDEPLVIAALTDEAVSTLVALDLVAQDASGAVRLQPLAYRFRDPDLRRARESSS